MSTPPQSNDKKPRTLRGAIIEILRNNNSYQTVSSIIKKVKEFPEFSRIQDDALKPQISKIIDEEKKRSESYKEKSEEYLGKKRDLNIQQSFKQSNEVKEDKILEEFAFVPMVKMSELGGFQRQKDIVEDKIGSIIKNWDLMKNIKSGYAKTFLISGPSGCGKSTFVQSIGGEYNVAFFQLIGPQIVSALSGESESKLRRLFNKLKESNIPSILFIDEIDTLIGKKENSSKEMESRIAVQLKSCFDILNRNDHEQLQPVFVIGSTCRPELIETSMRRSGIFDTEIEFTFPQPNERVEILKGLLSKLHTSLEEKDFNILAEKTGGYVACDLVALVKQAGLQSLKRYVILNNEALSNEGNNEDQTFSIPFNESKEDKEETQCTDYFGSNLTPSVENTVMSSPTYQLIPEDFYEALKHVKPNSLREGFSTIPSITWEDIGGLEEIKKTLELHFVYPIKHPDIYQGIGIKDASGILLYGPPGCGKTLLAKAVANASSANFISVKGPELLNKYVGESERAIRELFKRAKNSEPCVIFFDEFDALAPNRSSDNNAATDRVVNQLLTVTDGHEERGKVYLIAATNRKDMIDEAMLRDGRFGTHIEVPLPNEQDREKILQTHTKDVNYEYDLKELSKRTNGFSGADLSGLIRDAKLNFLRRQTKEDFLLIKKESIIISKEDFNKSLEDKLVSKSKD